MRKGSEKAEYGEHQQRNEAETERASQKMRPHRGWIAGNLPLPVWREGEILAALEAQLRDFDKNDPATFDEPYIF